MRITVKTIRNTSQRYATVGDWQWDKMGGLKVTASWMKYAGWRGSMAVAVHEIVEALLCKSEGIEESRVDEFDMNYDNRNALCEPGDHPDCPYRHQHAIASAIERLLVEGLGLNWSKYEEELQVLSNEHDRRKPVPLEPEEFDHYIVRSMAELEETPEKTP